MGDAGGCHGLHGCGPVNTIDDVIAQFFANGIGGGEVLGGTVGNYRHLWGVECDLVEELVELIGGRLHQCRVAGDADWQAGHAAGTRSGSPSPDGATARPARQRTGRRGTLPYRRGSAG